ncbi:unnamed protein product [Caretta caretta]
MIYQKMTTLWCSFKREETSHAQTCPKHVRKDMHLVPLLCHGHQCSSKLHRDASHHVDPVIVTVSAMNTGILLCMLGFILAITVSVLDKVGMKQLGLDGVIQQESKKVPVQDGW